MEAGAVFGGLKDLAGQERVEMAVSPYSGADLGMLAAEGWRDGFEQIQMGKQELQQTLGLGAPLDGRATRPTSTSPPMPWPTTPGLRSTTWW